MIYLFYNLLFILCILVVSNAVETLCDPTKRRIYDQTLRDLSIPKSFGASECHLKNN